MKRMHFFAFAAAVLVALLALPVSPASAGKPSTQLTIPTLCNGVSPTSVDATPTLQLSAADRNALVGGYVVFTWWDTYGGRDPAPNDVLLPVTVQVPKRVKQVIGEVQGFTNDASLGRRWVVAQGYNSADEKLFELTSADLVFCT